MTPEIQKACPDCAPDLLVVRTNKTTGLDFLGCSNWPDCEHTEELPLDVQMRRMGAATLPGFG